MAAWGPRAGLTAVAALVVFAAVATAAGVRAERVSANPLSGLAADRAAVTLDGTVGDDPRLLQAPFGDEALVRLAVTRVTAGVDVVRLRQPVVVFGSDVVARRAVGGVGPRRRAPLAEHRG